MDLEKLGISFDDVKVYYHVFVNDNGCLDDDGACTMDGRFDTYEQAVQLCHLIVEDSLRECGGSGETAFDMYRIMGRQPFILGPTKGQPHFSAIEYARSRCFGEAVAV